MRAGALEEACPRGDAPVRGSHGRLRGGVAGVVVVERRCYVDSAIHGHEVEGVRHVECAGDVVMRGDGSDVCRGEVL